MFTFGNGMTPDVAMHVHAYGSVKIGLRNINPWSNGIFILAHAVAIDHIGPVLMLFGSILHS